MRPRNKKTPGKQGLGGNGGSYQIRRLNIHFHIAFDKFLVALAC